MKAPAKGKGPVSPAKKSLLTLKAAHGFRYYKPSSILIKNNYLNTEKALLHC